MLQILFYMLNEFYLVAKQNAAIFPKFHPRSQPSRPSGLLCPLRPLELQIADMVQARRGLFPCYMYG